MKTFCFKHDVRMRETDLAGYAFYGSYLGYMDDARLQHINDIGFDIRTLKQEDFAFTVAEVHCFYLRPTYFQEKLWIYSRFVKENRKSIRVFHTITNKEVPENLRDGPMEDYPGVCHRGETVLVGIRLSQKRAVEIPEGFEPLFQ